MGNDNFEKPDPPEGVEPEAIQPDTDPSDAAGKVDAAELMLVAYLDGEMTTDERRDFDARLQSEPDLRRRLQQLRQAWDLLDELEACPPSNRFAETTLEMVAIDAESHFKDEREKQRHALRRRRNQLGLGLLVALITGFALTWFFYPLPDAMLIDNLPLIAKLDQYEAAESVAFLEALAQAKLFPPTSLKAAVNATDSTPTPPALSVAKETTLDQAPPIPKSSKLRRQWIENLEPIQRAQLIQYWEHFRQLPPDQYQQLLHLQQELAKSKQSKMLTDVMRAYSEWLRRQPSFTRTSLLDLPPADRIAKLRVLRREELDRDGLKRWLAENHEKFKKRFAEMFRDAKSKRGSRDQTPFFAGPGHDKDGAPGGPELLLKMLPSEDLNELKQYLSPETVKAWETKPINMQRLWVRMMIHRMMFESGFERRLSGKANSVSDEELAEFFEKRLTEKQKTELLSTSGELLHQNLVELYLKSMPHLGPNEQMPNNRGRGRGLGRGRGFGPGYGRDDNFPGGPPHESGGPPDKNAPTKP